MAFPGLQNLAKAPSKKFVDEVFVNVFHKVDILQHIAETLKIDADEAQQV